MPNNREMISEIMEVYGDVCTEWEIEFIDSLNDWDGKFTEKQQAVLERIYKKVCDSEY